MIDFKSCVADLHKLIEAGETISAMEKYYAEDVVMQENDSKPRVGKDFNIANEKENLSRINEFDAKLVTCSINETECIVFSEWEIRFVNKNSSKFLLEQVSVQHWKSDKVIKERFYYKDIKKL